MQRVFISYHHANDQWAKDKLQTWAELYDLFEDVSVNTDEVDDDLPTETIRRKIRDEYLRDSSVTIVLVGTQTKGRKHVDWEIYSSMYDGSVNAKSGIIVIQLPSTNPTSWYVAEEWEKSALYPDCSSWTSLDHWSDYQALYPYLPHRLIDNLYSPNAKIAVTTWDHIAGNLSNLKALIESAHQNRLTNKYDLSREMRRHNSAA